MKITIKNFLKLSALCMIACINFISLAMDINFQSPTESKKKGYDPRSTFEVTSQDHKLIKKNVLTNALMHTKWQIECFKIEWDQMNAAVNGSTPKGTGHLSPKIFSQWMIYIIQKNSQSKQLTTSEQNYLTIEHAILIDSTEVAQYIKDAAIKILLSTGIKPINEKSLSYAAKKSDYWLMELLLRNGANPCHQAIVNPIIDMDNTQSLKLLMHYGLDPFRVYPDLPYSAYVLAKVNAKNQCAELIMQPLHILAAQLLTSEKFETKLISDVAYMIASYVYGYYQVEPQLKALENNKPQRENA